MHEGWRLMARSRNIKPGFFMNEKLVELPFEARLMFIGLWTLADREGRLEDRPLRIKMSLFPADNVNADELLDMLHDSGFIQRYEVEDRAYIEVTAFKKHQNPHVKEAASVIPAPDGHDASTGQAPDEHEASPADPLNLIPDSLSPDSSGGREEDYPSKPNVHEQRFDQFWQAYPKKQNKGTARKAWLRIKPDDALTDTILGSVERHKTCEQWTKNKGQFIPLPATWLNAEGWLNELGRPNLKAVPTKPASEMTDLDRLRAEYDAYQADTYRNYGPVRVREMNALLRQIRELEAKEQVS